MESCHFGPLPDGVCQLWLAGVWFNGAVLVKLALQSLLFQVYHAAVRTTCANFRGTSCHRFVPSLLDS